MSTLIGMSLLICSIATAHAGLVFEIRTTHQADSDAAEKTLVRSENGNLKMEFEGQGEDEKGSLIYDSSQNQMLIVDHKEKVYMQLDKAAIDQLSGQMNAAMKQMQDAMKSMPPEQRQMMEEMMKERMPQAANKAVALKINETGKKDNISGYPVRLVQVQNNDGDLVRELWVTDWNNIKGGKEVAQSFISMSELFESMTASLSQMWGSQSSGDNVFSHMKDLKGFPVVVREYDSDSKLESESVLTEVTEQTFGASEFKVPSGYRKQDMNMGR